MQGSAHPILVQRQASKPESACSKSARRPFELCKRVDPESGEARNVGSDNAPASIPFDEYAALQSCGLYQKKPILLRLLVCRGLFAPGEPARGFIHTMNDAAGGSNFAPLAPRISFSSYG